ncbi:MAG TPA: zinc ribbon domain-containing protein [Anaerolineales bacterium]|nr:zinc ribbon domain-containing protein [Anaerolineales bacterium]
MRRIFRRQLRKAFKPSVPPILQEANLALDKGDFGRAAELFEQIAHVAEGRGGPRAPLFYLQAGRARLLAGQIHLGIPSLQRGLDLLAQRKQFPRLRSIGTRLIAELNEHGLRDEATAIEAWLRSVLPSMPSFDVQSPHAKHPSLPTHCPSCGAPLKPDEVEWLDEFTAECAYCGSPIREDA